MFDDARGDEQVHALGHALVDPGDVETARALLQQIAELDPATIEQAAFGRPD